MFPLFCKICKILTRGVKAVVWIDTKMKIYENQTETRTAATTQRQKTIGKRKDGQIQVIVVVQLQKVDLWHFEKLFLCF